MSTSGKDIMLIDGLTPMPTLEKDIMKAHSYICPPQGKILCDGKDTMCRCQDISHVLNDKKF